MSSPVLALVALAALRASTDTAPEMCFRVDSTHREVVIRAGPFRLPAQGPGAMSMSASGLGGALVGSFLWPVAATFRSFRLVLSDGASRPLPRRLVHHLYLLDFDRRELIYPMVQRVLGVGPETEDVSLPWTIGVPLVAGHRMGLYVMWGNTADAEIPIVNLDLRLAWTPTNRQPRPISVFPFFADVHPEMGGDWTFAIPPGGGAPSREFTLPMSGHLLALGGHLHQGGVQLRLEDAENDRVLVTLGARRDTSGRVVGVDRQLLALHGEGLYLRAGHRYRLVAVYANPQRDTLRGVMGTMAGLFAPDRLQDWPVPDGGDAWYQADLRVMTEPADALLSPVARCLEGGR